ncbi:MAG: hypothetical protein JNL94_08530 [Planctomycetes bacterium]|nr:hypothetical protein [Planctomycetota bacterium]
MSPSNVDRSGDRFRVERRSLVKLAALAVGSAGLAVARARGEEGPGMSRAGGECSYEEFVNEADPLTKSLLDFGSRASEDRYLFALATLAVRLGGVAEPEMRRVNAEDQPGHWIGANDTPDDCPFVVLHWKLAPGGVVRPHPHAYGNVVTLGLEGEVRVANHETVEAPDYAERGTFLVRRTVDQVLLPHAVNLVPLRHGFIHGFVAGPHGARGLDITTRVKDKLPNFTVDIAAEPTDARSALYEARWIAPS